MTRKPIQKPMAYTLQASQNYRYICQLKVLNEKWVIFKSKKKRKEKEKKGT